MVKVLPRGSVVVRMVERNLPKQITCSENKHKEDSVCLDKYH